MKAERIQTAFWFLVVIFAIVFLWHDIVRGLEPLDHSGCQYPLRVSNPPGGCDNTDPARPECVVHFGTEDCDLPYPTKPISEPVSKENVAPAPSEAVVSEPEPEITPVEPDFVGK